MQVVEYLDTCLAEYGVTEHETAYTAEAIARREHVPDANVAKPVVVKADDEFYMCVLPANRKIDFQSLQFELGAWNICLATESEMEELFPDCQVGTEPPFGIMYGVETLMDTSLTEDSYILFQGGSHETAISMSMDEYRRLAYPRMLDFSVEL